VVEEEEEEEEEKEGNEVEKKSKEMGKNEERWGRPNGGNSGAGTLYSSASSCPRQYSTCLCLAISDLLPSKIILTDPDACCKDGQTGPGEQSKRQGNVCAGGRD
jgi:hypothetical protein